MLIDIIAGARPNFMKIAPIIEAIEKKKHERLDIHYRLIHTGQHYDQKMSGSFFEELGIPLPHINLESGSGTQAEQTAAIMVRYEKVLLEKRPDLVLVVGDVTSTMACSITAKKLNKIQVAHVEGGIRSGDNSMPEEINRIVTDSITDYFFITSEVANENLKRTGVKENQIYFVGNTMIDTLLKNKSKFKKPHIWHEAGLSEREYIVLTLHRPSNVDEENHLRDLLLAITSASKNLPVIFPVHPRTAKVLVELKLDAANLFLIEPLSYLEFNYLVQYAKAVITDSGGITEEATVMGIPCMTLRTTTERPETCTIGTNELIGIDPSAVKLHFERLLSGSWKKGSIPPLWDGKAAERIVHAICNIFQIKQQVLSP